MQQGDVVEVRVGRRDTFCRPRAACSRTSDRHVGSPLGGQRGFSLLYVIVAVVLLSSLAAAVTALTPAAWVASVANTAGQRAYYMAVSGLHFWSRGVTGRYDLGEDSFTLSASDPDTSGYVTVSSLGRAFAGTPLEANVVLTSRRWGLAPITFASDIGSFVLPGAAPASVTPPITVYVADADGGAGGADAASGDAAGYAGGWMRLGNPAGDSSGAVWYGGDHGTCAGGQCPEGMCALGRCTFGRGLRAYFGFVLSRVDTSATSGDYGDGFTFTVMRGDNDPATAVGGDKGEYLGYAGPGPTGTGIAAPKLAVEVDLYPNHRSADPARTNSRNDQGDANHLAVVAWGDAASTLDDNVHGAGTAPVNPVGAGTGYVARDDAVTWFENGQEHTLRIEIRRCAEADGGVCEVLVWADPSGEAASDVTRDYADEAPVLRHTLRLGAADHAGLDTVYFGFTGAFGVTSRAAGAVQTATLHDFSLDFRR